MSGLQLAANKSKPGGGGAPPPIPASSGAPAAEPESATQTPYEVPPPGNAPPPPPPPPPPPALAEPSGSALDENPFHDESAGNGPARAIAVVLLLGVLGFGGWYLYSHPGLLTFWKSAPTEVARWPDITLTGMADSIAEGSGSAILNGNLIAVNQRIEGVTLAGIEEDGVLLQLGSEERFIRIGESTGLP